MQKFSLGLILLLMLAGCGQRGPVRQRGPLPSVAQLAMVEWRLDTLAERPAPRGLDDAPLTLRFDVQSAKAVGFAGCNRYSASYLVSTDRLSFGGPVATRKFCEPVMAVEQEFLSMLSSVIRYERTPEGLALYSSAGRVARFIPVQE
jgi:heat shock protein HslJ